MRLSLPSLLVSLKVVGAMMAAIAWIPGVEPTSPAHAYQTEMPSSTGETVSNPGAQVDKPAQSKEPKQIEADWKQPSEAPKWLRSKYGAERQDQEEAVRSILQGTLFQPKFHGEPLSQLVSTLEKYGLMVVVESQGLEEEGINLDESMHLDLPGEISLHTFLHVVLGQMNLGYRIEGGLVIITSGVYVDSLRIYDLSPLLPDNTTLRELLGAIKATVNPDHWEYGGVMVPFGSMLLVKCSEDTHTQIEHLLQVLMRQAPANIKPSPITPPSLNGRSMGGMGSATLKTK